MNSVSDKVEITFTFADLGRGRCKPVLYARVILPNTALRHRGCNARVERGSYLGQHRLDHPERAKYVLLHPKLVYQPSVVSEVQG